jgi:hypothetical protein
MHRGLFERKIRGGKLKLKTQEIKGEEAMEIFKLMKQRGGLPAKLNDLVPLSFIGQAAVSFYRSKIKLMDQLNMTEAQRKATLRDGQDAGEMLLDIETRIGELYEKAPEAERPGRPSVHPGTTKKEMAPKGTAINQRFKHSRMIARNPEIVEKVKAQARENEDIPTRTAVINEIRYQKEKQRKEGADAKRKTIAARIKELQDDGEFIIHNSNGLILLNKEIIENDEEMQEAFRVWINWAHGGMKNLVRCTKPAQPYLRLLKRKVRESLSTEERKQLSWACTRIKALLDYTQAQEEEEQNP